MAEVAPTEDPLAQRDIHAEQDDNDDEEMERLIARQALEDEQHNHEDTEQEQHVNDEPQDIQEDQHLEEEQEDFQDPYQERSYRSYLFRANYTTVSFLAAIIHIIYVLRSRNQIYLALLYVTSSKFSYILLGNAVLASFYKTFTFVIAKFFNGLRLMETETIVDHIRWNVTETCIALTMFRQEITVTTSGFFLVIILDKCLHWAVELRVNHLRMTEEAFYFLNEDDLFGSDDDSNDDREEVEIWWFWRAIGIFLPKSLTEYCYHLHQGTPRVRGNHVKIMVLMGILFSLDAILLAHCASNLLDKGPSIYIMFLFESAILVISIMSSSALYGLHLFDGMLNVAQRIFIDGNKPRNEDGGDDEDLQVGQDDAEQVPELPAGHVQGQGQGQGHANNSLTKYAIQHVASIWRDQRITATFFVELMALASKFLLHAGLFMVVFSLYGLPINIIRDFYMASIRLKNRLVAFASYRHLTGNMNSRFEAVTDEKELEDAGATCIICRDTMEVHGINGDCKKLPLCGHIFHKHCLREWLVQQQSCPTCRGDIQQNEARARALAKEAEEERQNQEETEKDIHIDTIRSKITTGLNHPLLCQVIVEEADARTLVTEVVEDETKYRIQKSRKIPQGKLVVCIDVVEFVDFDKSTGLEADHRFYGIQGGDVINIKDVDVISELKE